ncbi:MAG: hypothetical protein JXL85_08510 [Bacilli bacterium]|nr:hypothetical protein [Bacilli bacterium]
MDSNQLAFYKQLEWHLDRGEYLDIEHNIGYVFVYLYKLLNHWDKKGFEYVSTFLIYISELYTDDEKLVQYCLHWAHDCLLGQKKYDEYLSITEPKQPYGTFKDLSNLRLNIERMLGQEADPIDLLLLVGGRKTKFITENEALYKDMLIATFEEEAKKQGGWFNILKKWHPNVYSYSHGLFNGTASVYKPELDFQVEVYCSKDKHINFIKSLSRDAENKAREEMGVPKIGEGWISETILFRKLESAFSPPTSSAGFFMH